MPLDFSLWDTINRRMRKYQREQGPDFHETIGQWKARLQETAFGLEPEVIDKCMAALHRRVQWVAENGGKWYHKD